MDDFKKQMAISQPLQDLLLEIGRQGTLDAVLRVVVDRLAQLDAVALARIWLIRPGDICSTCPLRGECPDQTRCLHLVASAGQSRMDSRVQWTRVSGDFRRMPIGSRKVGRIGASGECLSVLDVEKESEWIARPDWARSEGIHGFAGQPLVFNGEILGVLAMFTRTTLGQPCVDWLRTIADLAAASIANARAFDEIANLRDRLERENEYLREEVSDARAFGDIVGQSPALRNILKQIELVAPTDANVLVFGESGTGKELVAQEIHRRSHRAAGTLVRVNCASIPRELYESEFFGHVKGAFTGAARDRAGRFELANGGTLFLDEVGEIPLDLQSKLLRVLQEGTYERVGDEKTHAVDVRVIAATNRDLAAEAEAGRFRQDLFYRLNVFPIEVPPLRKRKEDIPMLADVFVRQAARKFNREIRAFNQASLIALQTYDWPGNVRELMNVIERAVITSSSGIVEFNLPSPKTADAEPRDSATSEIVLDAELKQRERENIQAALEKADWKIHGPGGAAELLGLPPTTLASRVKRMGLTRAPNKET